MMKLLGTIKGLILQGEEKEEEEQKEQKEEDTITPPVAIGMISVEGEHVMFTHSLTLSGPVEIWLNHLLSTIYQTLHTQLIEACRLYKSGMTREQFVLHYCTQIVTLVCQIVWVSL